MLESHSKNHQIEYPINTEAITRFLIFKGYMGIGFDENHENVEHNKKSYLLVINDKEEANKYIKNPIKIEKDILYTKTQAISKLREVGLSIDDFEDWYVSNL